MYTEENTQQSFGSENLNEDSNSSFPEHSEHSEPNENTTEFSHDSNDADPQMRVGESDSTYVIVLSPVCESVSFSSLFQ